MKHLKKYKVFGTSYMRYLSKEELDELDESDINDYRYEVIQRNHREEDFNQYRNELELYCELRFENGKKFLQKLLAKHDPNRIPKTTDDRAEDLIVKIINNSSIDSVNNEQIEDCRKKVGTPKFIFGI